MSVPTKQLPSGSGKYYHNVNISHDARAQLGDIFHYNFSQEDPLGRLPFASDAPFNSWRHEHAPACFPNTRVDLLKEIDNWADGTDGQDKPCIFWLNGLAGTGKTTISHTIARKYNEQKRLGASFFFSREGGDVSNASKFFTTLAAQLAINVPSLRPFIREAVEKRSNIGSLFLAEQWHQLVRIPLSKLPSESHQSYILVVDALDGCANDKDVQTILRLLAEARPLTTVRLQVFLTSRPRVPIQYTMHGIPQAEHRDFILQNIPLAIVNDDIFRFLEYKLRTIKREANLEANWPGEAVLTQLVHQSSGLFFWAAAAFRFIDEGKDYAKVRLDEILKGKGYKGTPAQHLDKIYLTVLQSSIPDTLAESEKEQSRKRQEKILGSIAILLSPLAAASLGKVIRISKSDLEQTLEKLQAIIEVSKDSANFGLHHLFFRDFLLNNDRAGNFWVDEKKAHQLLAGDCIKLLSKTLKKDICELYAPGYQASQVESSRIQKYLPPEVQYASLYWVQHLQYSCSQAYDGGEAHRFLQTHLLHWLEALGWMGKTSEGIQAILSLEAHVSVAKSPKLHAFIYDAKQFVLYNRSIIEEAPLQLYCPALIFAPERSIVRQEFKACIPTWIQRIGSVQADWNTLRALEGHSSALTSVAFSPDGTELPWDAASRVVLQTLKGSSSVVTSVAFSPDGKQVVSGCEDNTVRLWDATTRALLQTLKGHSDISPDGKQVLSGSEDEMLLLWDVTTKAVVQKFYHRTGLNLSYDVTSVAFSPDGKQLLSGCEDNTVRLWDANTGALLRTLKGHTSDVSTVAFSPDGKQVASGSKDRKAQLWNAATGELLQKLSHSDYVRSVAFSPDSKQFVSGSKDKTVKLWNATTGDLIWKLNGHSNYVNSVAFSPDGKLIVSGSDDKTVKLWNAATGKAVQTLSHSHYIKSVAFSPDGQRVVSGSRGKIVQFWDVTTRAAPQKDISMIAFSPDGKLVVSSSKDNMIWLWNTATGAVVQRLKGYSNGVRSVAFLPDSKRVVSSFEDGTVRVWDAVTGAALHTPEGHLGGVRPLEITTTLSVSNDWVREAGENILWLPPDYRATSVAVRNPILALGHSSGEVSFLEVSTGSKPIL